jgi:Zn-dependent M28 family amino/carboxypeptidase
LAYQIGFDKRFSPGANDNASGVGILLALAEYYTKTPPQQIQLGFLFTGAEETGMHGAQAFASQLQDINNPIYILNLDMVGNGDSLHLVTKDGTLVQKATSNELNQHIKRAYPEAVDVWYTLKSGDYLPFLKKNIPATSIEMTGPTNSAHTYHTIFDTADKIDTRTLNTVLQTMIQVTNLIDKNFTVQ